MRKHFEKLLDSIVLRDSYDYTKTEENDEDNISNLKGSVGFNKWIVFIVTEVIMFLLLTNLPIEYRNLITPRQIVCWFLQMTVVFGIGAFIRQIEAKILSKKGLPAGGVVLFELLYLMEMILLEMAGLFLFSVIAPASVSFRTLFHMALLLAVFIELLFRL